MRRLLIVFVLTALAMLAPGCGGTSDADQIKALWADSTAAALKGDSGKVCGDYTPSGREYALQRINRQFSKMGLPTGKYAATCEAMVANSHRIGQIAAGKKPLADLCEVPGLKIVFQKFAVASGITCPEAMAPLDTGTGPQVEAAKAKLLGSLKSAIERSGVTDIKVTGDRATARDVKALDDTPSTEYFQKVDGNWKISGPA